MKGNEQIELKAQRYLYERAHFSGSCVVTTFDPFDLKQAFIDGAEWQYEQFEKERLKHCDELTAEQAQMESDFVVQHLKNFNRTPTFIDAIEYGRESMRKKAISRLESLCKEWHLHESTEAKYRLEAYKELLEILKED